MRTASIAPPVELAVQTSPSGETRKVLLELSDGARIETVLLRYRDRHTICASTQVGCACGCAFCATGRMGYVRQLTSSEIVGQVLHFQRWLDAFGASVSNVVFMGMGEPLLNREATMAAVAQLVDPRSLGIAPGRITLSTVGIAPGIAHLAETHRRWPIRLAISLHAATDQLRTQLMPINATYPLGLLREAALTYTRSTGRHILLEWAMIAGVNDTRDQALALAAWVEGLPSHVNLIRLNATQHYEGKASSDGAAAAFAAVLDEAGIPHTMRQRRGEGIDAGCGQLHASQLPS